MKYFLKALDTKTRSKCMMPVDSEEDFRSKKQQLETKGYINFELKVECENVEEVYQALGMERPQVNQSQHKIINLTQHDATPEQIADGVVEPENKERIKELLTFTSAPDSEEIQQRANELANIADSYGYVHAMIGGAGWLMSALEQELYARGISPRYSFSERVSSEVTNPDGTVKKVSEFKHVDWVNVWL